MNVLIFQIIIQGKFFTRSSDVSLIKKIGMKFMCDHNSYPNIKLPVLNK